MLICVLVSMWVTVPLTGKFNKSASWLRVTWGYPRARNTLTAGAIANPAGSHLLGTLHLYACLHGDRRYGYEFVQVLMWPRYPDKINEMLWLPTSMRQTVMVLWEKGMSARSIKKRLEEEQVDVNLVAIYKLLWKFKQHGIVADLPRFRTPEKLSYNQCVYRQCASW